jgi:hypothetical protein
MGGRRTRPRPKFGHSSLFFAITLPPLLEIFPGGLDPTAKQTEEGAQPV